MRYSIYLAFFFCFISSNLAFSQSSGLDEASMIDCWKCIVATHSKSSEEIVTECAGIAKKYDGAIGGEIAQLIMAKEDLNKGKYAKTLETLNTIDFTQTFLQTIVLGLKGDCHSELRNYKKANAFYEKAALIEDNTYFSPNYLFKAYLCTMELDEATKAQSYLATIKQFYPNFYRSQSLIGFFDPNQPNIDVLDIQRIYRYAEDYDTLGIGFVNDKRINVEAFSKKMKKTIEQNARNISSIEIDEKTVLDLFIESLIYRKEYASLGLNIANEEFQAYLFGTDGFSVLPDIKKAFVNPITRAFDPGSLQSRISDMENSELPKVREQWNDSKKYYIEQRMKDKYMDLIELGIYITRLQVLHEYHHQNDEFKIEFDFYPYSHVSTDEIEYSDKDLRDFFSSRKKNYTTHFSSRRIDVIEFPVSATKSDIAGIESDLEQLKTSFKQTDNDSMFVMTNSDIPLFVPQIGYRAEGHKKATFNFTYPAELDKTFKNSKIGDVIGPYREEDVIKIAKVIRVCDVEMTARHILIGTQRKDYRAVEIARKTTDSLMELITPKNFAEYVKLYSEDYGSVDNDGKYSNFLEGEMVPEFNDYSMNQPIGKIGYVQTDFGFHIMEVLDRKPTFAPGLAVIQKNIVPSEKTIENELSSAANLIKKIETLIGDNTDPNFRIETFKKVIKTDGFNSTPTFLFDNDASLKETNLESSEEQLLQFAYGKKAQIGAMLSNPIRDKDKFLLFMMTDVTKEGITKYEDHRNEILEDYIKYQQGLELIKRNDPKDYIGQIKTVQFNEPIMGYDIDAALIGAISRAKTGVKIENFSGKKGLYTFTVLNKLNSAGKVDLSNTKDQLLYTELRRVDYNVRQALQDKANIINNLNLFRYGIRP